MAKGCFKSNYFIILVLIVFFMLLYVYAASKPIQERFSVSNNNLIPADKLIVVQGNGIPDVPVQPSQIDNSDPSAFSVDGTEEGPRSKFFFAYNQCKPECCSTSGGYSCNGGCPCITQEQQKITSSRGYNRRYGKCAYDEADY